MSKLIAVLFEEASLSAAPIGTPAETGSMSGSVVYSTAVDTSDGDYSMALSVLKTIQHKAKEVDVELEDAVVLYKTPTGETRIKQTKEITTGKGAKRGVFWGLLAGVILGGPLAGLLIGLGAGAIYGKKVDHGIDDKFLKQVARSLDRNHSAVMIMVGDDIADRAVKYLETFDAEVIVSDLNEDAEAAAEKAAENEAVADAVAAEYAIE